MADFSLNNSKVKKIFLSSAISAFLLSAVFMTGCAKNDASSQFGGITFDRTDIKVTDKVNMRVLVSNPYSHQYEYRYAADRGQIIANNGTSSTAQYYAPFTGGPDTVRVSIYDRTDNINLPTISQQTTVQGESMAYVDLPNTSSPLNESDNALIKVSSVRGSTLKKDIGWGRTPT
ncbi:MAG: hypothetical protein H7263_04210, partial [Candidatus Sericytochromatia bacterium]|nr:hypothetical protein [Candidatus Sericytochromatia bacterium]